MSSRKKNFPNQLIYNVERINALRHKKPFFEHPSLGKLNKTIYDPKSMQYIFKSILRSVLKFVHKFYASMLVTRNYIQEFINNKPIPVFNFNSLCRFFGYFFMTF